MHAHEIDYWNQPPSDDAIVTKDRDAGLEQVVQLLPSSFEGIMSQFEEELGVGAWMVAPLTGDVYWSEGTYRIHDVAPGTPLGLESALSYFAEEDVDRVREIVEEGMQRQRDYVFEATLISETGRRKRIRSYGRHSERDGVPILSGIIRLIDQPD